MARKLKVGKSIRKGLKKEVTLPINLPSNKLNSSLNKKRRILGGKYFIDSWAEIKKVVWPNRKETIRLMFAVIVFTAIFTTIISIADIGIGAVVERILL